MTQRDLFGGQPPTRTKPDPEVSLHLRLIEARPKALLLATHTLPEWRAWVPAPPVKPDPDHADYYLMPSKLALAKGFM